MDTQELINKLNSLSPYGINITNNDCNEEDFDNALDNNDNSSLDRIKHYKTNEWKVTSYFNPSLGDISYTAYNEDLNLALEEMVDWCKENLI